LSCRKHARQLYEQISGIFKFKKINIVEGFMMKRLSILLVLLMISAAAFSNVKISGKHKDKMKDSKKVNCAYCHTDSKIEKKKGQVQGKSLNGVAFSKIKSCAGPDCHK